MKDIGRVLDDRQKLVVATIRMRLTNPQSLAYLEGHGYKMSRRTYSRIKAFVESKKLERLHNIAATFEDQHMDRLDTIELIEQKMWEHYYQEQSHYKCVMILKEIKELQPYKSSYYESTASVIKTYEGVTNNNNGRGQEGTSLPEQGAPESETKQKRQAWTI